MKLKLVFNPLTGHFDFVNSDTGNTVLCITEFDGGFAGVVYSDDELSYSLDGGGA